MSKRSYRDRSDDEEEESEMKRPVQLTEEQRRFVNIGFLKWSKIRQEWTRSNIDSRARARHQHNHHHSHHHTHHSTASASASHHHTHHHHASGSSSSSTAHSASSHHYQPPTSPPTHPSDVDMSHTHAYNNDDEQLAEEEEDDSSDDDDSRLNLQHVMECLKTYRPFERPIKLRTMIDIVTVLWEDEPT